MLMPSIGAQQAEKEPGATDGRRAGGRTLNNDILLRGQGAGADWRGPLLPFAGNSKRDSTAGDGVPHKLLTFVFARVSSSTSSTSPAFHYSKRCLPEALSASPALCHSSPHDRIPRTAPGGA
jgi:hypothetical protein